MFHHRSHRCYDRTPRGLSTPLRGLLTPLRCYIDDICDSVDTVMEAKQQTEDIDTVLEKGGFKVKGWISNKPLGSPSPNEKKEMAMMFQGSVEENVLALHGTISQMRYRSN